MGDASGQTDLTAAQPETAIENRKEWREAGYGRRINKINDEEH